MAENCIINPTREFTSPLSGNINHVKHAEMASPFLEENWGLLPRFSVSTNRKIK